MLDFTTLKDSILNNVYINDTNTYRKFDNTGAATGANTSGDIVEAITLRTANVSTRDIEDAKIETNGGNVGGITYVPFNSSKYNIITDKYDYDSINQRLTNDGFRELETYKNQLRVKDYVVQYGGSNIDNIYYLNRNEVNNDLVAGSNLSIEALKQIQDIKDVLGGYVGANIEGSTAKIKYIKDTDDEFKIELTETQKLTRQAAKHGQDIKDFIGGDFGGSNYINEGNAAFANKLTGTQKLTRQAAKRGQDIKDFDGGSFGGYDYINEDNDAFSNVLLANQKLTRRAAKRGQDIKDFDGGDFGGSNYITETNIGLFSNVLTGTQKLTRQAAKRGQDIKDFLGGDFGGSNYIIQSDDAFKNKLTGTEKLTRQAAQRGQDIKDFDGGDFGGIKYVNNRSAHTNSTDINNFEVSYDYGNRLSYLKYTENTLTETLTRNELISLRNAKETTMTTNRTIYWTKNDSEATISEWKVDNDEHGSNFLEGSFPDAFNIVQPSHNYDSQQKTD